MARTITSANATVLLAISNLFDAPQQLQGFAADDIYTSDDVAQSESLIGVDGQHSAGFVYALVPQTFAFMADSDSIDIFEQWALAQRIQQDIYYANATVILPSVSKKFTCTKGALSTTKWLPDAARVLQARRFRVTWESVVPQNV